MRSPHHFVKPGGAGWQAGHNIWNRRRVFGISGEFDNSRTFANVVALQSDGKIVAAGQIGSGAGVLRLNTNGTLDSGFGTGGMVTINSPGSNEGAGQVIGVANQPDGKIVAEISNANADASPLFVLARLNVNGSLDTTFGSTGIVATQIGSFGNSSLAAPGRPDGSLRAVRP